MIRQPLHDPHAVTSHCIRCGMTHEEMLDYDLIECADAKAAALPVAVPGWTEEQNDVVLRQRGLIIEGLGWRAGMLKRAQQAIQRDEHVWTIGLLLQKLGGEATISMAEMENFDHRPVLTIHKPNSLTLQFALKVPEGAHKVTAWPAGFSMVPEPPAPLTSPYPDKYRAALAGGRIAIADLMDGRFTVDELAAYAPWETTADGLEIVSVRGRGKPSGDLTTETVHAAIDTLKPGWDADA